MENGKCSCVLFLSRSRRRRWWLNVALIVALFFRARARRAFLRRFLQQKRRAALRAMFGHRFVPINDFALRIFRTAVEGFAAHRLLDQQFALASGPRTRDARRLTLDVFALRIVRAGNEFAKTPETFYQLRTVNRTFLVNRLGRRAHLATLRDLADVATLGIAAASVEWSKPATP